MTTHVVKNKWDGGHAEDLRTHATDECEKSLNFDIFTNPHKLIPYPDTQAETADAYTIDDIEIADVDYAIISGTYYLMGVGYETNVSVKPTFWNKSSIGGSGTINWSSYAVSAGNTYQKRSGVVYKDQFYALGFNGSNQYSLYRFNSAGSVTAIGTISSSSTDYAKPFVHPQDNILYIIIGTSITTWDGSNLATTTTILPTGMKPVSVTDYGSYLAIGMTPARGNGNITVYLWGRDTTVNTLQGSVDFGEGSLAVLENLNNNLFAVVNTQNSIASPYANFVVKGYSGGAVENIKTITILTTQSIGVSKVKNGNRLYFGSANDDCVFVLGKNKSNKYIVTKDRYFFNGTTIGSSVGFLAMIGQVMWRGFATIGGVYTIMRSLINSLGESFTYSSSSIYKTTINPNMPLADRYKLKTLKGVRISFTGKASGTIKVKHSIDGSNLATSISETTTAIEDVKESDTIAVTSSPFTVGESFDSGREFQFQIESTGGVEVKELEYWYDIIPTLNPS